MNTIFVSNLSTPTPKRSAFPEFGDFPRHPVRQPAWGRRKAAFTFLWFPHRVNFSTRRGHTEPSTLLSDKPETPSPPPRGPLPASPQRLPPELKALLGRHVPYCHALVKSGGLADALGLTARPSVGLLLGLLERWAGGEGPQPPRAVCAVPAGVCPALSRAEFFGRGFPLTPREGETTGGTSAHVHRSVQNCPPPHENPFICHVP